MATKKKYRCELCKQETDELLSGCEQCARLFCSRCANAVDQDYGEDHGPD